jgi:hypothetical protein
MKRTIGARFFFDQGKKRIRGEVVGWASGLPERSIIEWPDPSGEGTLWAYDTSLTNDFTEVSPQANISSLKPRDAEEHSEMSEVTTEVAAVKTVSVLVSENPKRAGSASHVRFQALIEAVAAGVTNLDVILAETAYSRIDLNHDVKKGFVAVA